MDSISMLVPPHPWRRVKVGGHVQIQILMRSTGPRGELGRAALFMSTLKVGLFSGRLFRCGRRTPLTGLWVTAFFSQGYSKSDDSADRRWPNRGDHMRAGDGSKLLRPHDTGEPH